MCANKSRQSSLQLQSNSQRSRWLKTINATPLGFGLFYIYARFCSDAREPDLDVAPVRNSTSAVHVFRSKVDERFSLECSRVTFAWML